jgi:uncharacterized protein YjbJ (UPF0337 family)
MDEIIDKTKGKIKQAVGDLTGDKRIKREGERDDRKAESKAWPRMRSARSMEEPEIDSDIQQSKGRKLL